MPFESKAQQRFMFAKHPKMAKEWASKTEDIKHLPEHVNNKKAEHEKKSSLEECFTKIAQKNLKGLIRA